MRDFLGDEEHLPSSVAELNVRVRRSKGHQKTQFTNIVRKLTETFSSEFPVKQVIRKWQSLCDGFKLAIDNHDWQGQKPLHILCGDE